MIGQLNRRINVKSWGDSVDEAGGLTAIQIASYIIWARVENRNGRLFASEQQEQWSYDYKVTFRYEKSRVVSSNMTIDYDGKRLVINSLSYQDEGQRTYCIARCSATDLIPVSDGGSGTIEPPSYYNLNILFRVGDEGRPQNGDTDYTLPVLIGLDENKFTIFRNGLPMYPELEYHFDSETGKITLLLAGDQFYQGEQFLIK